MYLPRIAILISGTGSNMEVILKACITGELPAEVSFVGSDNINAKGLDTASALGAQTRVFFYKRDGRKAAEEAIATAIKETKTDWIILAGFMKVLSPEFVRKFPGKIINIHPAMLPSFPGAHGIRDAWEAKADHTGVTVHIVDEEVDHGHILAQERIDILPEDTLETLEERIHRVEHRIYKETLIKHFSENPISIGEREE
ncbi:MAG: phosphoribosylglycinamide formyltransferase [Synergistaceae bacterium]